MRPSPNLMSVNEPPYLVGSGKSAGSEADTGPTFFGNQPASAAASPRTPLARLSDPGVPLKARVEPYSTHGQDGAVCAQHQDQDQDQHAGVRGGAPAAFEPVLATAGHRFEYPYLTVGGVPHLGGQADR